MTTLEIDEHSIIQDFANVSEWITFIKDSPAKRGASNQRKEYGFNETNSLKEAITLAEQGWPEGMEKVHKLSVRISEELVKILHVPEVIYDVTGDQLDIGRHIAGEPDEFMSFVPAEIEQHPKVLHVVASIGAISGVSASSMIERGAAVVAMIDALESHGKRVILDCVSPITRLSGLDLTRIRVKEADAPLQLANLVFLLAHPDSLRRLVFACREQACGARTCEIKGYGSSRDLTGDETGDIYIKSLYGDETAITGYVLAQLSEQGIYAEKEVE